MAKYPTFRQTERTLKNALPCTDCDCQHRAVTVNVFLDDDTLRVTHYKLNCGKMPLVDLTIDETQEDDIGTSGDDGSDLTDD